MVLLPTTGLSSVLLTSLSPPARPGTGRNRTLLYSVEGFVLVGLVVVTVVEMVVVVVVGVVGLVLSLTVVFFLV